MKYSSGPLSTTDWTSPKAVRNDFQLSLLWLRSMEIAIGHSMQLTMSELEMDLFSYYRSSIEA